MQYQEFSPQPALRSLVKCYWQLEGQPESLSPEVVVPDGRMEMIFQYGDVFRRGDIENCVQTRTVLAGQLISPIELIPTGRIGTFAVRFRPQGFTAIFEQTAVELKNKIVSLADVFPQFAKELEEPICLATCIEDRVAIIEKFLLRQLERSRIFDRFTRAASQIFSEHPQEEKILQAAAELGISLRQLERQFKSQVGLSPSTFIKISRFQQALRLKLINPELTFTTLAVECGYYDQSHFSREFKELAGLSPRQYFQAKHGFSDLFTI